jgi:NADH-quinone oxidoreductase subunit G
MQAAPSVWVQALAGVACAIAQTQGSQSPIQAPVTAEARAIADSLLSGSQKAILLGNGAAHNAAASSLLALAQWIGQQVGASVGYLTEAANTVGAQLVKAQPQAGGLNAGQMLSGTALKACVLLNTDPELDAADPVAARAALDASELVVVLSPFKTGLDYADVLLPTAPFTETSGSFVNAEGRLQSFVGVAKALGDTRPGWKILRVLGNLLGLPGFDQQSSEAVRDQALGAAADLKSRLSNVSSAAIVAAAAPAGLERYAPVPIYAADELVRRAPSLQATADAPAGLWAQLGLVAGDQVRIVQDGRAVQLPARMEAGLPANVVRVSAGLAETAPLGAAQGTLTLSKV